MVTVHGERDLGGSRGWLRRIVVVSCREVLYK